MFPLSSIISTTITFLQTISISINNYNTKITTLIQRIIKILSFIPPVDARAQMIALSFVVPSTIFFIFIFPLFVTSYSHYVTLYVLGMSLYAVVHGQHHALLVCAIVCLLLDVATHVVLHMRDVLTQQTKTTRFANKLSIRLCNFYTQRDSSDSIADIQNDMHTFINNTQPLAFKIINIVVSACFVVFNYIILEVADYGINGTIPVLLMSALSVPMFVGSLLSLIPATRIFKLSSICVRVAVVVLEALYMPTAETAINLLHKQSVCDNNNTTHLSNNCVCYSNNNNAQYKFIEKATHSCACNTSYSYCTIAYGQPWINYNTDVMQCALPYITLMLIVYIVALPVAEYIAHYKSVIVIRNTYSVGENESDKYNFVLMHLNTSSIYTFFMYSKKYIYTPVTLLVYKLLTTIISHIQYTYNIHYILFIYFIIILTLYTIFMPHYMVACRIMAILMHSINAVSAIVPLLQQFKIYINSNIMSALSVVAACIPILIFVAICVDFVIKKKKLKKKEIVVMDNKQVDCDTTLDRIDMMYGYVDMMIDRIFIDVVGTYGNILCMCGCFGVGYVVGMYIA